MNFGEAIEAVKNGKLVTRSGWNGKGMFIFQRPADDLPITIVLGAKSLPKRVKDYYERKHQPIVPENIPQITFTAYLCMKAANDTVVNGWLASQTDMLAEDWHEFEL
jgi:hypothetical protein